MRHSKIVLLSLIAGCMSIHAVAELWRYAQSGDPAIVASARCARQARDFSFNHLYCLAHQPFRDPQTIAFADQFVSLLVQYNEMIATQNPLPPQAGFAPYVRKLMAPPDAAFFVWSDVHGAALSLFKALDVFYQNHVIDDHFTITHPHTYFIFLGDYQDRGYRNILTLTTILRLATQNPEQVILLRGNHETNEELGGNSVTLKQEFQTFFLTDDIFDTIKPVLDVFYNTLPVGFFLGNQLTDGQVRFLQFNHGALEIGMDVRPFLANLDTTYYPIELNRAHAITRMIPSVTRPRFAHLALLDQEHPEGFGLIWADFCTTHAYFDLTAESIRACYGRTLTNKILRYQTRGLSWAAISTIIRGHQHGPPPHLGNTLALNQGVVRSWDGLVYTINTSGELFGRVSDPLLNERFFFSSWLRITPTTDIENPWHIEQWKVFRAPSGEWQFAIVAPPDAPAGAADLCEIC